MTTEQNLKLRIELGLKIINLLQQYDGLIALETAANAVGTIIGTRCAPDYKDCLIAVHCLSETMKEAALNACKVGQALEARRGTSH